MDKNCNVEPIHKVATETQIQGANRAVLSVGGMGCENCATRVRNGLLSLDGVYAAEVRLSTAVAEVLYDRRKVSPEALKEAVHRAGNDGHHEYRAMMIAAE